MMFLKSAITSAALLAGGLVAATPQDADAQVRFSFGSGYGNNYYGNGYGYRNSYYNGGYGHGSHLHRDYHDTSHYDYHPATIQRHGNHYHYQPGHYDYHQTGHYDYYRH